MEYSIKIPDFANLLRQFDSELSYESLISEVAISPDEYLYGIETNQGLFYVFETDYITSLQGIRDAIAGKSSEYWDGLTIPWDFIPSLHPLDFDRSTAINHPAVGIYKKPEQWSEIAPLVNDQYGSRDYYLNFLLKPTIPS